MLQDQKYARIIHSLNHQFERKQQNQYRKHLIRKKHITKRYELCKMLRENKTSILETIQIIGGIIYYVIRVITG